MNPISKAVVEEMCRELTAHPSLSAAMDYVEARQPEIVRYLMVTFEDGRVQAGMRASHLGWCVYRAFELASERPIRSITMLELAAQAQANQQLVRGTRSTGLNEFMEIMSLEMAKQPALMEFVRHATLVTGPDSNSTPDRELLHESIAIFLAVKTVVDTLDSATN